MFCRNMTSSSQPNPPRNQLSRRRTLLATALTVLVAATLPLFWHSLGWPPLGLVLKHGLPPSGGPTGRTLNLEGVLFVELRPGYFLMGSHDLCTHGDLVGRICSPLGLPWGNQPKHGTEECPPRWVEISSPFWIAATEVTVASHQRLLRLESVAGAGNNFRNHPVCLSHLDAQRACDALSASQQFDFRLPTEAEWEYACRAGSQARFSSGDNEQQFQEMAWYISNSTMRSHAVGTRSPNLWGLYDMHGNFWEWCTDIWCADPRRLPTDGSAWTEDHAELRVIKGGSWDAPPHFCRSATRLAFSGQSLFRNVGFRPVFTLGAQR